MTQYLLPQNDGDLTRKTNLEAARAECQYRIVKPGVPLVDGVPSYDQTPLTYGIEALKSFFARRSNLEAVKNKSGFLFDAGLPSLSTVDVVKLILSGNISSLTRYYAPDLGTISPSGRPKVPRDYDRLFIKDPLPDMAYVFESDVHFANFFVAGPDPYMIEKVSAVPEKFPFTEKHVQSVPLLRRENLLEALQQGRVFIVDYKNLSVLEPSHHPQQKRYVYAPIAAFMVRPAEGSLIPFAIQLGQSPKDRTIYTPTDGWSWRIAKDMIKSSACSHSAIVTHLTETHLLMEIFVCTTYRHLSTKHPLHALLKDHFTNTLRINEGAFEALVGPGQFVDRIVGNSHASGLALAHRARMNYDFKKHYLPRLFRDRGTAPDGNLRDYAVRDDGLMIWEAMHQWISDYVAFYYPDDNAVKSDFELTAWAQEIASPDVGHIQNFGTVPGAFHTKSDLVDALTMILYISGPGHAVVNFIQKSAMVYHPAAPLAGFIPEIRGYGHTEKDWLNFLAPLDVALVQETLFMLLGSVYFGQLGHYSSTFSDAPIAAALKRYQNRLTEIESLIHQKNKTRIPYTHLLPSKIPQSINI